MQSNAACDARDCVCVRVGAAELGAVGGGPRAGGAARARREEGARAALLEPERGPGAERHDPPLPGRRALQTRVPARQRARQRRTQARHTHLRHPVRNAHRSPLLALQSFTLCPFLLRTAHAIFNKLIFRHTRTPLCVFLITTANTHYSFKVQFIHTLLVQILDSHHLCINTDLLKILFDLLYSYI